MERAVIGHFSRFAHGERRRDTRRRRHDLAHGIWCRHAAHHGASLQWMRREHAFERDHRPDFHANALGRVGQTRKLDRGRSHPRQVIRCCLVTTVGPCRTCVSSASSTHSAAAATTTTTAAAAAAARRRHSAATAAATHSAAARRRTRRFRAAAAAARTGGCGVVIIGVTARHDGDAR